MAYKPNFYQFDVKYAADSSQALKTREELGLSNLMCGQKGEALETLNKDCYGIVMDKQRNKAYIVLRVSAVVPEDVFYYASTLPDLCCSDELIGLL